MRWKACDLALHRSRAMAEAWPWRLLSAKDAAQIYAYVQLREATGTASVADEKRRRAPEPDAPESTLDRASQ
jgi:hypothetical protein